MGTVWLGLSAMRETTGERAGNDPFHSRGFHLDFRNFVDPAEVEDHGDEREDKVCGGPGHANEHALPAWVRGERAWIFLQRFYPRFARALQRQVLAGQRLAGHLDVAAKKGGRDAVVGFADLDAEEAGRKTERELLDAELETHA